MYSEQNKELRTLLEKIGFKLNIITYFYKSDIIYISVDTTTHKIEYINIYKNNIYNITIIDTDYINYFKEQYKEELRKLKIKKIIN